MAKRKIKCKNCESMIESSEAKVYSGKKYCESCYNSKVQDHVDYENLLKLIMTYYNVSAPTGLILKQIKEFKDKFNYLYTGMAYCLWYCKEIKNLKFDVKYGIAIIKYEYENAKAYFIQQQKVSDSVTNIIHEEKIKEVKVNLKRTTTNKDKFLINIDDLLEGGDLK